MKQWKAPEVKTLSIELTATSVNPENQTSGEGTTTQEDLWTCSNPYWEGSGKTPEEAKKDQPSYWEGGWGQN